MRTLYVRFVVMTIVTMMLSGSIAFIGSNLIYHQWLKPKTDAKLTKMAYSLQRALRSENDSETLLHYTATLGYSIVVFHRSEVKTYGKQLKTKGFDHTIIESVRAGTTYHGVANSPQPIYLIGFFKESLTNTIGVPIVVNKERASLFLRADVETQFGELRRYFALLLGLSVTISLIAMAIYAHFFIQPIRSLMKATKAIAQLNFTVSLPVERQDELGSLARQFALMADSLNKTDQMRRSFVTNVSHDIQTPLTIIRGLAAQLQQTEPTIATAIAQESERLTTMTRQYLLLARLDHETAATLRKEAVPIRAQWYELIRFYAPQWQAKNLSVEWNGDDVTLLGEATLLYQVWQNVLTNAIKFSTPHTTITVHCTADETDVTVAIRNEGTTIPAAVLPHLFEAFYQADDTRHTSGSGLGLNICAQIIALHHGTITVASERNETTFTMTLPRGRTQ